MKKISLSIFILIAVFSCIRIMNYRISEENNKVTDKEVISKIKKIMPHHTSRLSKINDLASISIGGHSYMGILSVLDREYPVLAGYDDDRKFSMYYVNSKEKNHLYFKMAFDDYSDKLKELKEYDVVTFTTVRGEEYKYLITSVSKISKNKAKMYETDFLIVVDGITDYLIIGGILS